MSFQIGESVGDYQIISILGAGGMGKVYKVKNSISERVDAMKVLLPNLADDPELADRFIREIKVLASLEHPNIAGLRTAFRLENQLLMVMEFVEGTSLDERCKQGRIPVADAINYTVQALAALGYAHKHGVIHRDIKPANMMLTPDGVVKLMDFGIAKSKSDKKLTQTGTTMGSLFYMSAEQVQGNELDGRSDLYSIGVSLYEMVTGSRPFSGKSDFDIMIAQLQQTPQQPMMMMPDLPKALNDIIMIALEKDPAKRFQTAEAFSAALGSIGNALNATPVQASYAATPGTVAPGAGTAAMRSSTGMLTSPPAPISTAAQPVAVGGAPPAGYNPTANTPTVMAPQPQPGAAAVPSANPPYAGPATGGSKGYRGLYMALGALIVVAVLALAAIQVPRFLKTHAGGDQTAQVAQNSSTPGTPASSVASASAPAQTGAQPSPDASNSAGNQAGATALGNSAGASPLAAASSATPSGSISNSSPAPAGVNTAVPVKSPKNHSPVLNQAAGAGLNGALPASATGQMSAPPASAVGAQTTAPNNAASPVSAQELTELQDQHDKLATRAVTVDQSVENLRKQMAAGGNNLRADISAAQTRIKMNMDKFDTAMGRGDLDSAKHYKTLAEHDIEFLEKYFNI